MSHGHDILSFWNTHLHSVIFFHDDVYLILPANKLLPSCTLFHSVPIITKITHIPALSLVRSYSLQVAEHKDRQCANINISIQVREQKYIFLFSYKLPIAIQSQRLKLNWPGQLSYGNVVSFIN